MCDETECDISLFFLFFQFKATESNVLEKDSKLLCLHRSLDTNPKDQYLTTWG